MVDFIISLCLILTFLSGMFYIIEFYHKKLRESMESKLEQLTECYIEIIRQLKQFCETTNSTEPTKLCKKN